MNERLQELAAKTGIYGAVDINGNYDNEAEVKKFAELIVRECANIVQDSPWQLPQRYNSIDQANLIKKYFGVEE